MQFLKLRYALDMQNLYIPIYMAKWPRLKIEYYNNSYGGSSTNSDVTTFNVFLKLFLLNTSSIPDCCFPETPKGKTL